MHRDRINVKGLFFGAAIIEALKKIIPRDTIPLFFENTLFYALTCCVSIQLRLLSSILTPGAQWQFRDSLLSDLMIPNTVP